MLPPPRIHLPRHRNRQWHRDGRKQGCVNRILVFRREVQQGQHAWIEEGMRRQGQCLMGPLQCGHRGTLRGSISLCMTMKKCVFINKMGTE